MFQIPNINKLSSDDLNNAINIFLPEFSEYKRSDYDGVLDVFDILYNRCINNNKCNLIKVFKLSEECKHILPTTNKPCRLVFTASVITATNEKTFS